MLLPITLPMARPGIPLRAAMMVVASSGRDVPTATTVRPMMASLTPSDEAIPEAPSTNQLPPPTSAPRPTSVQTTAFHIGMGGFEAASSEAPMSDPQPSWARANVSRIKMANRSSSTIPSARLMMRSGPPSHTALPNARSTSEETITIGMSAVSTILSTLMGLINAATPTIMRILKMLLPTTLPMASSA